MTQDIYHQNEPPRLARKRRRWLSLKRPDQDNQSSAAAVGSGTALRIQEVPRGDDARVRRRRRSEHSPQVALINSVTCISVSLVAVGYLAILAGTEVWTRKHPPTQPVQSAKPGVAPPSVIPSEDTGIPLTERIGHWRAGVRIIKNLEPKLENSPAAEVQAALESALRETPEFARARMELARALIKQKKYDEANALLLGALDSNPDHLAARILLAQSHLALGQNAEALALAQWAIESDSFSIDAQSLAATALLNLNRPDEAINHLKKLTTLNREDLTIENALGTTYLKIGDFRSALQTFREILKISPDNTTAYYNMAVAYARQMKDTDTVDTLSKAKELFGSSFVSTWITSSDFDPVRETAAFQSFLKELSGTTSAEPAATETNTAAPTVESAKQDA